MSKVRHSYPGFTRASVIDMARLHISGLREGDFEIRQDGVGDITIDVRRPLADLAALAEVVRAHAPIWCVAKVASTFPEMIP